MNLTRIIAIDTSEQSIAKNPKFIYKRLLAD